MNNVEAIGIPAVSKAIKLSGLSRFVIFRSGSGKGATPIYECTHVDQNSKAVKCFEEWATNIYESNPYNQNAYRMMLFKNKAQAEDMDEDAEADETATHRTKKKSGKIQFHFMLCEPMNGHSFNRQGPVDVQKAKIGRASCRERE